MDEIGIHDLLFQAVEAGQSRSNPPLKRPVRTQAVVDQSDVYTHVLSAFTENKVHYSFPASSGLRVLQTRDCGAVAELTVQ
jgi:hypothetical protein